MLFRMRWLQPIFLAIIGCLALLIMISVGGVHVLAQPTPKLPEHLAITAQKPDLGRHFKELGLEGSIVIDDSNNDRTYEYNPQRNATEFPPASTFKIFNAMVALETGVISDDVAVFTWDGIHRDFPEWNHDTNLRQAFKNSTVWFYQVRGSLPFTLNCKPIALLQSPHLPTSLTKNGCEPKRASRLQHRITEELAS